MDAVLRCRLCNKPFDQESTLKRHGYYCRSRKRTRVSKTRSCTECIRTKSRCDGASTSCSRCRSRGIGCHYPLRQHGSGQARRSGNNDTVHMESKSAGMDGKSTWLQGAFDWTSLELDSMLDPKSITTAAMDHASAGPNPEVADPWARGTDTVSNPPQSELTLPANLFWMQEKMPIPSMIPFDARSLFRRPQRNGVEHKTASLLFNSLGSYPLMLSRQNALPPFIHPTLLADQAMNDDMEFLCNCISLMHMVGKAVQGSKKLFWRNVRHECERMCETYLTLNQWELLAAIQALFIYLLVRLCEGETEHNNIDALLITAVTLISQQTNQNDATRPAKPATCNGMLDDYWRDWIYEESKRRICVVYQVVNMLVYFEPAMLCDFGSDLILAPLPSKKRLWEASDESSWILEDAKERENRKTFGLATNGQLVKLSEDMSSCREVLIGHDLQIGIMPHSRDADWREWCSEMDALGGIVMLAASLHE